MTDDEHDVIRRLAKRTRHRSCCQDRVCSKGRQLDAGSREQVQQPTAAHFMSEAVVIGGEIGSQLRSAERIFDGTFSH
ncbi:hypothetical protein FXV83_40690 [Bradyrhizobium hipponense]|uniref:Uncharacterized protein n=1 Tax=Bradyrhizobium hipponense TaxID=2605638 RepID=A0A5S4Y959_9BRAD|nr:hypothetical protein [Bradyrhizobium hipponense]TYO60971.1 hypothetical protein FXV83_40690 [Bradyrhizobium hipponense]